MSTPCSASIYGRRFFGYLYLRKTMGEASNRVIDFRPSELRSNNKELAQMTDLSGRKLFEPIRVGKLQLAHRVVLAPLTRIRADEAHVPTPMMVEYYAQRASTPGTLLIAEGTFISPNGAGYDYVPGIWSDAQIEGWKKVTDAVHAQGSYIYLQLYANGRVADPNILFLPDSPRNQGGPYPLVAPSPLPLSTSDQSIIPHELTHEEILEYIDQFALAASNAVRRAGFDGVEVHCANGYLIDQFLQDTTNKRTDEWGGSVENRIRFAWEVVKKVVEVVGEERTGIRLSPFSTFQDMRMENPYPTFAALTARAVDRAALEDESNDFLRAIWKCRPDSLENGSLYITAGGYTPETAVSHAERGDELVVFGRYFISNPDLPARIKNHISLTHYNRSKFYVPGSTEGYIDYEFADGETKESFEKKKAGRGLPN